MKKESIVLKNAYTILSKNIDVTNHYVTEVINDEVVLSSGANDFYNNDFKIQIQTKDNITFIEKLLKQTKVNIEDIDLSDNKVITLFDCTDTENDLKRKVDQKVTTSGILYFQSYFIKDLLLDLKASSIDDLVKILNLSSGSKTWLDNASSLLYSKKTLNDVINYLCYIGMNKEDSIKIAELVGYHTINDNKDAWNKYIDLMKKNNVPNWYIDSLTKIEYLKKQEDSILDAIYAVIIGWFKVYYPLDFYSIYFSNFINTSDKFWFNITKEELSLE